MPENSGISGYQLLSLSLTLKSMLLSLASPARFTALISQMKNIAQLET